MKYKALLWDLLSELISESRKIEYLKSKDIIFDTLDNTPLGNISVILGGTDLVRDLTYLEFKHLLNDMYYLNDSKRKGRFKEGIVNPESFNLLINAFKTYKKMNMQVLENYKGKEYQSLRQETRTFIKGCDYYIEQLQNQDFLNKLPLIK